MYIKTVKDFDAEAHEADVIVTDGQYEILCYAQPFDNNRNSNFVLSVFRSDNIMQALENKFVIEKSDESYYAYRLQGKLFDIKKKLVAIGKIIIQIEDAIPKDIDENEFVEFNVLRIDLLQK